LGIHYLPPNRPCPPGHLRNPRRGHECLSAAEALANQIIDRAEYDALQMQQAMYLRKHPDRWLLDIPDIYFLPEYYNV
jgi:hypothetical protein